MGRPPYGTTVCVPHDRVGHPRPCRARQRDLSAGWADERLGRPRPSFSSSMVGVTPRGYGRSVDTSSLNDRQIQILNEVLGRGSPDRPEWPRGWGRELRAAVTTELLSLTGDLPDGAYIRLDKFTLSEVLACEGRHQANEALQGPFQWDVPKVRGTVAHRAMERLVLVPNCSDPLDLTNWAIDDLSQGDDAYSPAVFLKAMEPGERHELVREVNDLLVKFVADFPPLPPSWLPRCESPIKMTFGAFGLRAVPDVAIGTAGTSARVLLVDLKTGRPYSTHPQNGAYYTPRGDTAFWDPAVQSRHLLPRCR